MQNEYVCGNLPIEIPAEQPLAGSAKFPNSNGSLKGPKGMQVEIVILRHGKPKIRTFGRVSASGFGQWIDEYDAAGIDATHVPPQSVIDRARSCSFVVCSSLPRSTESATLLGIDNIQIEDPLFRECEMPYAGWKYPRISVAGWAFIFRIFYVLGSSSNAESFKEAKKRANTCALRLVELAQLHGSVLFVGHGALNWLIIKNLLRTGWVGPRNFGSKHWELGVYHRRPVMALERRVLTTAVVQPKK